MITAYLFDLDGTLVDSMTDGWVKMLREFVTSKGGTFTPDLVKDLIALGLQGGGAFFKKEFGLQESVDEIVAELVANLQEKYEKEIPAKESVEYTLRALKAQGKSLNVLTASPHLFLDPCLKRLGLYDLFDNLWSVEDFPLNKAEPKLYQLLAQKLGRRVDECAMVDDSIAVVRSAKQGGMYAVGIYDEFSSVFEKEMQQDSDRYIYKMSQLLEN